jgi:hypothetical protein
MLDPHDPAVPIDELLRQADSGDRAAHSRIREHLKRHPEIVSKAGDLSRQVQERLVGLICGSDQTAALCLCEKLEQMRAELGHDTDPPALRLLTVQVTLDWLNLHLMDLLCAKAEADGGASTALVRKKQTAHRMYCSSLRLHSTFLKSMRTVKTRTSVSAHSPTEAEKAE